MFCNQVCSGIYSTTVFDLLHICFYFGSHSSHLVQVRTLSPNLTPQGCDWYQNHVRKMLSLSFSIYIVQVFVKYYNLYGFTCFKPCILMILVVWLTNGQICQTCHIFLIVPSHIWKSCSAEIRSSMDVFLWNAETEKRTCAWLRGGIDGNISDCRVEVNN